MKRCLVLIAMLAGAAPLAAQQHVTVSDNNPLGEYLFPPDLVMAKQFDIGLTDAQREAIRVEVQKAQSAFTDLQFKMAPEGDRLSRLLQAELIDEARVLAQVDQMLQLEREIKRRQIALLIRIRNTLTVEQRAKLTRLQSRGAGD